MQLIDIIQLIFLGFTFISLGVLVITYFAYRRRKQSTGFQINKSSERITKTDPDQDSDEKPVTKNDVLKTVNPQTQNPVITKKKKNKFEVFKPASDTNTFNQSNTSDKKLPPKTSNK
ncbi:MAG: hypothetical protein RBR74_10630 [Ignavibacteriaceae bacterium]|jgi:hypothetical protein|nr:hypothetical protein [Ignavibacteriaceae bacterium]